jgi:tripartite-type tricarboxylate transporter receptor subunit TctC
MMTKAIVAAVALALTLGAAPAHAQDWPSHPIELVVPFAAGGPVDFASRLLAPHIAEILGQQIVIENLGGAGGMTGSNRVAKSAPDGYTFVVGTSGTHASNQTLFKKPLYNAATDFAPVGVVFENTKVLLVRNSLPVKNLQEFVAYMKANHDKMQFGSAGAGSATHLGCVLFNARIGVDITHVPYRGSGPAMQDLIAGRIDYVCEVISTAMPQIESKLVRPIALLSTARVPVLPDLPTALEQGVAGVDSDGWNAYFMPAGTPDAIVRKLNAATGKTLDIPAVRERLLSLGLTVPPPERRTVEWLAKLVPAEIEKWGTLIKAAGLSAD